MGREQICTACLDASNNHRINNPPCNCQEGYYDSGDEDVAPEIRIQCISKTYLFT